MAVLCHSAVSHSTVSFAATGTQCAGLPDTQAGIPDQRTTLQLGRLNPFPPSKAGSLSTLSRFSSGYTARGSRALVTCAGFTWTSAASVRFEWLFKNHSQSTSELAIVKASQSANDSIVETSNPLKTETVSEILLQGIVPGPPSEVIPFVFGEVSDIDDERSYLSYVLELLVSWEAHPGEFERVFWRILKQQVTGTRQLCNFVAFFLTDRKTAVRGLTGSQLGRHFEGAFLEEGRSNPVTHQLNGLYDVFETMGRIEWMRHDDKGLRELCKQFKTAREGESRERLRFAAQFPREEPPWRTSRATLLESGRVEQVALPEEAASGKDSEAEVGSLSDASGDSTGKNQPLDRFPELRRGKLPAVAGQPADVVPFVFGEASDVDSDKDKEKHYEPLIKELLMSWYAFPDSFENVFWKTLKQQTTGTYQLKNFLAFFLTDRDVSVGELTGAALQKQLEPRFLEEARFNPVTHQLDGLIDILEKILWRSIQGSQLNRASGMSDYLTLDALCKEFRTKRKENEAEDEGFPREVPPWRLIAASAERKSSDSGA